MHLIGLKPILPINYTVLMNIIAYFKVDCQFLLCSVEFLDWIPKFQVQDFDSETKCQLHVLLGKELL